jgi:hypothetical protein
MHDHPKQARRVADLIRGGRAMFESAADLEPRLAPSIGEAWRLVEEAAAENGIDLDEEEQRPRGDLGSPAHIDNLLRRRGNLLRRRDEEHERSKDR